MSRNHITDYKKGEVVDTSSLLPEYSRSRLWNGISKNILNRFLTKKNFEEVTGYVGRESTNTVLSRITEESEYLQKNQLQEVISATLGAETRFLTFQKFLNNLERDGVDLEKFDKWGKALQFNFLPPINIDKLINYQDYYWTDRDTPPNYITIESQTTRSEAKYDELKRGIFSDVITTNSADNLPSEDDGMFILHDVEANLYVAVVKDSGTIASLDEIDGWTLNLSSFNEYIRLDREIISLDDTELRVSGSFLTGAREGFILSLYTNLDGVQEFVEVESYEFDEDNNESVFILKTVPETSPTRVSVHPYAYAARSESIYFQDVLAPQEIDGINVYDPGEPVWYSRRLIFESNGGFIFNLGDNTVNQYFGGPAGSMVATAEYGIRILEGPNAGDYDISSFTEGAFFGDPDEFVVDGVEFFKDDNFSYEIYIKNQVGETYFAQEKDFYYDEVADILYQIVDGILETKIRSFSILYESENSKLRADSNDWAEENKWVHKNQITNLSESRQAVQPIIEYKNYIELSEFSRFEFEWAYRATATDEYKIVEEEPNLFEIQPVIIPDDDSVDSFLTTSNQIVLPSKFGNLMSILSPGDKLIFDGFSNNSGEYTVENVEFIEYTSGERYQTVITIVETFLVIDESDGGGKIYPETTSLGDAYDPDATHWAFVGIKNITPSGAEPERNPMLDLPSVSTGISTSIFGQQYQTKVGLYWQEFNPDDTYTGARFELDSSLTDLCLIEDYQEGDLRLYIDGERVYGKHSDIPDPTNTYVAAIVLDDVTVTANSLIRIELGEYWLDDIGRRAVPVFDSTPDSAGSYATDTYNLSRYKRIEQTKTRTNQYPLFKLYDIFGNPLEESNSIFWFKENGEFDLNRTLDIRAEVKRNSRDLVFEHGLVDSEGRLRCYLDLRDGKIKTIWKRGEFNEQSVPQKVGDVWDIPNNWKYNIKHELRKEVSLTDLFRHFKTITLAQQPTKYNSINVEEVFHALDKPNFGLGGTIKEHNGNLDLLVSAVFGNQIDVPKTMDFVADAYERTIREWTRRYLENLETYLGMSEVDLIEDFEDFTENNTRWDRLFGDSFTYADGYGIKNVVSTAAILRMSELTKPAVFQHNSDWIVKRHDGTYSKVEISNAQKSKFYGILTNNTQKAIESSEPFPNVGDYEEGDYLVRGVSSDKTISLYQLISSAWVEIDVIGKIANLQYELENLLYAAGQRREALEEFYDLRLTTTNDRFSELEESEFLCLYGEDALRNSTFKSGDAFTWNYANTDIQNHPLTGVFSSRGKASWQALYKEVYGTAYPHREPWVLQGYEEEPTWWRTTYRNTDINIDRFWKEAMWDNIFSGIVPAGQILPNGDTSTGAGGETQIYDYSPVNITGSEVAGVGSDELAPPYWDGSLSGDSRFKPLFDKSLGNYVASPNADFLFGQEGPLEWQWKNSTDYVYFLLKASFWCDPIEFFSRNYGDDLVEVDCLLVNKETQNVNPHSNTLFHGDYREDGTVYYSSGIQQWIVNYNRYQELDGGSSDYRELWTDWEINASYVFNSLINDTTLGVAGDRIDIVSRDYQTFIDRELKTTDNTFSAINWAVQKRAPITERTEYETSNWVFKPYIQSPKKTKTIEYYPPQNYRVRLVGTNTFTTGGYQIKAAEIEPPRGFWRAIYSSPLSLTDTTGLVAGPYQFTIDIDGSSTTVVQVNGATAPNTPTVGDVIDDINSQLTGASIDLENGFLVIRSNSTGIGSSIAISSDNLFSTIATGFTSEDGITDFEFEKVFYVDGNALGDFAEGDEITISTSTNYDGSYTVDSVAYDFRRNETLIKVLEDVVITDSIVDGIVSPENVTTIPWETGQEVFVNTDGVLPGDLLNYVPYYIHKINDTTFQLSESEALANQGTIINFPTSGSGSFWVGKVTNTFKPLNKIDYAFRRHEPDTRFVKTLFEGQNVTRIQSLIDIVFGYEALLEDRGIKSVPFDKTNKAENSGRDNEWILELEKYIVWLDELIQRSEELPPRLSATVNVNSSSFDNLSGSFLTTGQAVRLKATDSGQVPDELESPFNSFVPYYTIITRSGNVQLAFTRQDAQAGRFIEFSTGSGEVYLEVFKTDKVLPKRMTNPYYKHFVVTHDRGLPSSFERLRNGIFERQNIFDVDGNYIDLENILFFRNDKETSVLLTEESNNQIVGADYSIFEVSHICRFNQYTTGDKLIYDPFLGIKTPRVFLSFLRPSGVTGRTHVGGLVLSDNSLIDNIEKSVQDIRDYYDVYSNIRGDDTTDAVRRSVGYQGPKSYMEDLGINDKSQFVFWKSFIQSKGTNFSLEAFTNQKALSGVSVDEFWAYKLCEFGDPKKKAYPEIKLKTDDVVRTELRLEFVPPTGGTVGKDYIPIRLTDVTRWENLPDVAALMQPFNGYFLDVETTEIVTNAETAIGIPEITSITDNPVLRLTNPVYGANITYEVGGTDFVATEGIDYRFINSYVIEFIADNIDDWENVTVTGLSYSYDSTNIFKLVDNRREEKVVTDIPIWNPALGQENPLGDYPIDFKIEEDPASYTDDLVPDRISDAFWEEKQVGKVWLDTTLKGYVPYYDKFIFPTQEERSLKWGNLAEYADIEMYRWIESDLSPEEYIREVANQSTQNIPMSEKLTGTPRSVVYQTDGSGGWIELNNIVRSFPKAGVNPSDLNGFEPLDFVDLYVNGEHRFRFSFVDFDNFLVILALAESFGIEIPDNSIVTLVRETPEPTEEQIEDGVYSVFYPHSKVEYVDRLSGESRFKYYFWVRGEKSEKLLNDTSLTLFDAERELADMTRPYAIIEGFRNQGDGYGVLFGDTYDPEENNLPLRFSQLIVKGLADTVKNNSDYVLRLRKDFTLRDDLGVDLQKKNKHVDWKLIRRNQTSKIDFGLWRKVVESITGFEVVDELFNIDTTVPVPSEERARYDALVAGATTRIGLGATQTLVDRDKLRNLLEQVMLDPTRDWSVGDIEAFYESYDLTLPEGYVSMLREIYASFTVREVNDIFFEILENSMIAKRKHPDFFKTSWVAVDVGNSGTILDSDELEIVEVFPTELECAVDVPPSPTPTPTPTVSTSSTATPTPTPTPSSSPEPAAVWVDITSDTYWTGNPGDGDGLTPTVYVDPCWQYSFGSGFNGLEVAINSPYGELNIEGVRFTLTASGTGGIFVDTQVNFNALSGGAGYQSVNLVDGVPQTIEYTGITGTIADSGFGSPGLIQANAFAFSGNLTLCSIEVLTSDTIV